MKLVVPEGGLCGKAPIITAGRRVITPGTFQFAMFSEDLHPLEWAHRQRNAAALLHYIRVLLGPAARDYLIDKCINPADGPVLRLHAGGAAGYGYEFMARADAPDGEIKQAKNIIAHALDVLTGRKKTPPLKMFLAELEAAAAAGAGVDVPIAYRNLVKMNHPRGPQPGALVKGGKVHRFDVKQTTTAGAYALGMLAPPVGEGKHEHLNAELAARIEAGGLLLHGVEHRAAAVLLAAIYAAESGKASPCRIDVCSVLTTQLIVNAAQFAYAAGIAPHGVPLRKAHLEEVERVFKVLECVCLAPRAGQDLLRLVSDHDTAGLADRYFAAPEPLRGEVMFYVAIPARMYYGAKYGDPLPVKLTDELPVTTFVEFKYKSAPVGEYGDTVPTLKAERGEEAARRKEWAAQLTHLAQVHFLEHGGETELLLEWAAWDKVFDFGAQLTKNPKRCKEKLWAACKRISHLDSALCGELIDAKHIHNVRLRITRAAPKQPPQPKAAAPPKRRKKPR